MTPLQRLPSRHRDPRYDAALVLAVSVSGRWWPQIAVRESGRALPRHSKIGDERLLSEEGRSCSRHPHHDRV
jgi:hypothetical protein